MQQANGQIANSGTDGVVMKRNRAVIIALRRMFSRSKGVVVDGHPSVEFSSIARCLILL